MAAPTEGHIPMRLLGAGRLSNLTDETTSPERQTEVMQLGAKIRGDRLIDTGGDYGVCMDLDVSGAVSPFQREQLGPWLTDPDKINQWDGLIIPKLDRISRSLLHWQLLLEWCDKHGKIIISVSEGFDLGTPWGRMVANMLIVFAQFERERISERCTEAAQKLRELGRWHGGRPPYGYMVKDARLYQHPDTQPVVRQIVNWRIDGYTVAEITRMLNADGVPPARGARQWKDDVVKGILGSRALLGELQYQGRSVRDNDGNPVMVTDDPLITESEWALLVAAQEDRAQPKTMAATDNLLLYIAKCGECDAPLHIQQNHGGRYIYYRCTGKHGAPGIRAEVIIPALVDEWLKEFGDDQIVRRAGAGKDYAAELRTAQRELDELEDQYLAHSLSAERFASMSRKYETRIAELSILAAKASGARWEPTGETVRQRWDSYDTRARNAMLQRLGVTWYARRVWRITDRKWKWIFETRWQAVTEAHERLSRMTDTILAVAS